MNLFDLFATISLDSSEYEQGLEGAEKSTSSFGDKLKTGLGAAAQTATAAVAAVAGAATTLGVSFVAGAKNLAVYGDEIDKESQKLGISAEAYQEWDAILQHTGGSISNLKPALKTLSAQIVSNSEAFQQLGLSQEEIISMPIEDVLSAVITKLQDMEPGVERTALATKLLGRSSVEMGALLNTSSRDTDQMRKRVHELGGVLSNTAVKSAAGFQDSLQDMKTAMSGVKNEIMSEMLPGLTDLMDGFASLIIGEQGAEEAMKSGMDNFVSNITKGVGKFFDVTKTLLPMLATSITENLPTLAKSAVELLTTVVQSLMENSDAIIRAGADIVFILIQGIKDAIPQIGGALVGALDSLFNPDDVENKFSSVISALATFLPNIIGEIGTVLAEAAPVLIQGFVDIFIGMATALTNPDIAFAFAENIPYVLEAVAQAILDAIPAVLGVLPTIIDNIITTITENIPLLLANLSNVLQAVADGIIEALPVILEKVPQIISALVGALVELIPQLVETGVTLITALIEDIDKIIEIICDAIPGIIDALVNALLVLAPEIINAGIKLLTALIEKLPEIIDTICEALPEIINSIVDALLLMIPMLVDAGVQLLTALVQNLPYIIDVLCSKAPEIIGNIIDALVRLLPQLVDAGVTLLTALVENLPQIIREITKVLPKIIGRIIDKLVELTPQIIESGFTLFTALVDNLPEIIKAIVTELPRIINGILNKLTDSIPDLIAMGFDLLVAIISDLPGIIVELAKHMPEIIDGIVKALGEGITAMANIGKQLLEGLWEGIKGAGEWLWDQVSGFFGGIWDGIKGIFDIFSPSKKMAWIGEMLDKGLAQGIDKYADVAIDAAETMSEDVMDAVNPTVDFSAGARIGGAYGEAAFGGRSGGITINVQGADGQDVNELAEVISQKLAFAYTQEQAVWA